MHGRMDYKSKMIKIIIINLFQTVIFTCIQVCLRPLNSLVPFSSRSIACLIGFNCFSKELPFVIFELCSREAWDLAMLARNFFKSVTAGEFPLEISLPNTTDIPNNVQIRKVLCVVGIAWD